MPTSGRWRSSTGDWCKLAGWHRVSLPDRESALGPPGVSGDLWGKLLASSLLWHHRGTGDRERESERERERELEALQNKTAEESPRLLCQLIYVALWLGVATEPDTCWSPHDWTHLWTNWTLQGHLDTDDTRHTRVRRQTHAGVPSQYTRGQNVTYINTLTRVCTQSHSGCWCDRSVQAQTVRSRRRIIMEGWRSYFRLLEIQRSLFSPPAALLLLIVAGDLWC